MNLAELFNRIPRMAFVAIVPIVVFLGIIAVTLGSGDDDGPAATSTRSAIGADTGLTRTVTPTRTRTPRPTPAGTATPTPNREDCDQIRGTDYLSPDERQWYLANCTGGGGTASGGGEGRPADTVYASEYGIGARLVIPSLGIDTSVTGADVGPDGLMPDPVGYFNAVLYNFPNHVGLGGSNKVMAAHVDCAACVNGGPGQAVFWAVRNLTPGATAQYVNPDGSTTNYVVVSSYSTSPNGDWSGIVASGAADMTLITCTGSFAGGEYSDRHVVQLVIQ